MDTSELLTLLGFQRSPSGLWMKNVNLCALDSRSERMLRLELNDYNDPVNQIVRQVVEATKSQVQYEIKKAIGL